MKRRLTVVASLICIVGGLGYAQPPSPAPPKIAVLIVTGQNGHNWRGTTPVLRKILEDTGKFEVRALCDLNAERLDAVADEFSVERRTTSFDDVLAMNDIDIVDICTPPTLHFPESLFQNVSA